MKIVAKLIVLLLVPSGVFAKGNVSTAQSRPDKLGTLTRGGGQEAVNATREGSRRPSQTPGSELGTTDSPPDDGPPPVPPSCRSESIKKSWSIIDPLWCFYTDDAYKRKMTEMCCHAYTPEEVCQRLVELGAEECCAPYLAEERQMRTCGRGFW